MTKFVPGDRVKVNDPFLAQLKHIAEQSGEEMPPNNTGTVYKVNGDEVIINFDDGCGAPYPVSDVELL